MQRDEQEKKNVEKVDENVVEQQENEDQEKQEKVIPQVIEDETLSISRSEDVNNKQQVKIKRASPSRNNKKIQSSLNNIRIESPVVKKKVIKTETKMNEKGELRVGRSQQSYKVRNGDEGVSNSKAIQQSYNRPPAHKKKERVKRIEKPFYQQTYYITGMRQNYLLLLSDRNQVLQFPIGMFTTYRDEMQDVQNNREQQQQQGWNGVHNSNSHNNGNGNSNSNENYHLIRDIKIGQAIKIKLQLDYLRQEKDDRIFNNVQRGIREQYSYVKK